ncbi:MAG: peroxiredoxin family protein [Rhodospirillales bacterium]
MPAEGAQAPDFKLEDLNGQPQSLKEMLARGPVLLAFYKASCPVCQMTFPYLERLYQAGKTGLQFVAISQDNAATARRFNTEYGITFPTLIDDKAYTASNAYGLDTVPSLFLVEPDGTVSMSWTGFSKKDLEALGRRLSAAPFREGERVPDYRPG